MMNTLAMIGILGGLIWIHELGHWLAARWLGLPIAIFSVGFGPKVLAWSYRGTEYRLSAIPLGGYVLPAVEDEAEYFQWPRSKRMLFALGGPAVNVILAVALFGFYNALAHGLSLQSLIVLPWTQTTQTLVAIFQGLLALGTHPEHLSGVVGLVNYGAQTLASNGIRVVGLTAAVSLNLAVFNLLPIPALDGGKLVLILLEAIHPKLAKLQLPLTLAGFVLLLGLIIYITILDIQKLVA